MRNYLKEFGFFQSRAPRKRYDFVTKSYSDKRRLSVTMMIEDEDIKDGVFAFTAWKRVLTWGSAGNYAEIANYSGGDTDFNVSTSFGNQNRVDYFRVPFNAKIKDFNLYLNKMDPLTDVLFYLVIATAFDENGKPSSWRTLLPGDPVEGRISINPFTATGRKEMLKKAITIIPKDSYIGIISINYIEDYNMTGDFFLELWEA